jgi:hypothetical protein
MLVDQPATHLSREGIRQLVARVCCSIHFKRSPQLVRLLEDICARTQDHDRAALSEQQIGERVFKRPPSYDTGNDSIVRAHARLLRKKLALYFAEEGKEEPVLIVVPRGTYVPQFVSRDSESPVETSEEDGEEAPSPILSANDIVPPSAAEEIEATPGSGARSRRLLWVGCGIAIALALFTAVLLYQFENRPNALFRTLFRGNQATIFVPGDSGLILYQNLVQRNIDLPEYSSGVYLGQTASPLPVPPNIIASIASRRYTSMADLKLGLLLMRVADRARRPLTLRYARDMRMEDLKDANVVINGDPYGNPWVKIFDPLLNFTIRYDQPSGIYTITNAHPAPGEQAVYRYDPADPNHTAYAIISLVPNLTGTGSVLLIESTTMAGSDAAADFLGNEADLRRFLDSLGAQKGPLRFDMLLRTSNIALNSPRYKIEAYRTGPHSL